MGGQPPRQKVSSGKRRPWPRVLRVLFPVEMSAMAGTGQHGETSWRQGTSCFLSGFLLTPALWALPGSGLCLLHTPRGRLLAKEQSVITHLSHPPTKPLPPWSHPPDTPPPPHTHALPISGCLFRSIPRFRSPSVAWSEMLITRRSSSSRLLRLIHSFLRLPPPRLRPPHAASLRL